MAEYQKMTLARFEEKLGNGEYKNLAGARRAIGKLAVSRKDKDRAGELATAHFMSSVGSATAKKPAKKVALVKVPTTPKRKPGRPRAVREETPSAEPTLTLEQLRADPVSAHMLGTKTLESISSAIAALASIKTAEPSIDITEAQDAVGFLAKTARFLQNSDVFSAPARSAAVEQNGTLADDDLDETTRKARDLLRRAAPPEIMTRVG